MLKGVSSATFFTDETQAMQFTKQFRDGKKLITEQLRKPEYYTQRDARFIKAGTAEVTKETLASISSDRASLYGRIRKPDGTINRQDLTNSELFLPCQIQFFQQ